MTPEQQAAWLAQVRGSLSGPGQFLAYQDGEQLVTVALENEWTRVGRSLAGQLQLARRLGRPLGGVGGCAAEASASLGFSARPAR